ncbi:hypothetical protein [Spirulina sp. 06S082]|uniref:hypothetical protein n=1 Tax=Spirulina sp. 06S082 TaxID=3110248 RepID=UPI002B21E070|nr:hypothetical protein [Spirulina sp. 06S082]MEA5468446.1 hypothetical protein [Spirulina sp. 06S082]
MESNFQKHLLDLEKIVPDSLKVFAREHLEYCNYKVSGYWDEEDNFYGEIIFPNSLSLDLAKYSVSKNLLDKTSDYEISLEFLLTTESNDVNVCMGKSAIATLTLIFDSSFRYIDEKWAIDVQSPAIVAKIGDTGA